MIERQPASTPQSASLRAAWPSLTALCGVLAGCLLPLALSAATSSLQITEIMYNPVGTNTGRQWIEVRNGSTDPIDLSAKDIRVSDASGNHLLKTTDGTGMLAPGEVTVIAENPTKFKADWPSYSGTLMKSAFALTAAGTVKIIRADGSVLATATYDSSRGGKNDGNSLQLVGADLGAGFTPGAPTPGIYSEIPSAPIVAKAKPVAAKSSSIKQQVTHKTYDPGTVAPPAPAITDAGGALSGGRLSAGIAQLVASVWFSSFLLLLAFSAFSLMLLLRYV